MFKSANVSFRVTSHSLIISLLFFIMFSVIYGCGSFMNEPKSGHHGVKVWEEKFSVSLPSSFWVSMKPKSNWSGSDNQGLMVPLRRQDGGNILFEHPSSLTYMTEKAGLHRPGSCWASFCLVQEAWSISPFSKSSPASLALENRWEILIFLSIC